RGRGESMDWQLPFESIPYCKAKQLQQGGEVAIVSTGAIGNNVTKALSEINNSALFSHYHFGYIKPIDKDALHKIFSSYKTVITIEGGTIIGGFGSIVFDFAAKYNYCNKIITLGVPDEYIEHGSLNRLQQYCGIDVKSLKDIFSAYSK